MKNSLHYNLNFVRKESSIMWKTRFAKHTFPRLTTYVSFWLFNFRLHETPQQPVP